MSWLLSDVTRSSSIDAMIPSISFLLPLTFAFLIEHGSYELRFLCCRSTGFNLTLYLHLLSACDTNHFPFSFGVVQTVGELARRPGYEYIQVGRLA